MGFVMEDKTMQYLLDHLMNNTAQNLKKQTRMSPHESTSLITEVYRTKHSTQDLVSTTFEYAGKQKVTRQKYDYTNGVYVPYDGKQNLYVVIIKDSATRETLFTSKPYSEGCITNIYQSALVTVIDEIYNS